MFTIETPYEFVDLMRQNPGKVYVASQQRNIWLIQHGLEKAEAVEFWVVRSRQS